MGFLIHQLGQLVMVVIIMACALFGTVGIIKLIKKFFPFIDLQQNLFRTDEKTKKDEYRRNHMAAGHKNDT